MTAKNASSSRNKDPSSYPTVRKDTGKLSLNPVCITLSYSNQKNNFLFIQFLSTIFLIMMMNYKTVENVYLCWAGSLLLNWLARYTLWYNSENFIKLFMPKKVDIQLAIFIHANSRLYFCRHTLWDFISPCICHIFFKFIAQPIDSTSLFLYENTAHYNCYATKYRIWKLNVDCLWMLCR